MKILTVLALLFFVLSVAPISAQEDSMENFYVLAIQSFGWKCDRIQSVEVGLSSSFYFGPIHKITCEWSRVYYVRSTLKVQGQGQSTFCHKGTCKKFE